MGPDLSDIAAITELNTDDLVKGVIEWARIESPSLDADAVNRMVDHVQLEFETVDLEIERTPGVDGWRDLIRGRTTGSMRANKGILDLFQRAESYSQEHDLVLEYTSRTGGGSDGNLTAAEGVPTLDGLGAEGYGAHQLDEHIYISSLEPRARTWMKLIERLD